jgi:hypothetical protein
MPTNPSFSAAHKHGGSFVKFVNVAMQNRVLCSAEFAHSHRFIKGLKLGSKEQAAGAHWIRIIDQNVGYLLFVLISTYHHIIHEKEYNP